MKTFNAKATLEQPKRLMQFIGLWPQTHPSFSYKLRGFSLFTLAVGATVLLALQGVQDFKDGNYETGSFALCLMTITFHTAFKVWFILTNTSSFYDILRNLESPSLLHHDDKFAFDFQNEMQFNKKMFKALVIAFANAGISVVLCEFALGYDANPRVFPIKTDLSHPISYIIVWLYFSMICIYAALTLGACEGVVLIFVTAGIAQLKILQKEIIQAVDYYPSEVQITKEEMQHYDKMVNRKLSECVRRHNAIERFIASIEAKFSLGLLVQYIITLSATGLIGLNFIFASPASIDFLRCMFFFIADLAQAFVIYYHCNEIILESNNIRDACYFSNWTACGPSVRKTLFIIMERTKRPSHLTIGKFSIISLNTFVVLYKTSMSYFTVLKSMYGDIN